MKAKNEGISTKLDDERKNKLTSSFIVVLVISEIIP